jgi:HlyD family secretion protein
MKRIWKVGILFALLVAVIVGVRWYASGDRSRAGTGIRIYGTIDIRDASLAFNEQERISKIFVEEGDRVTAGQVLAQLKTDRLDAGIAQMRAQIAAQQEVVKRLKAGSRPQEIAQARAEVAAAQARVQNARLNFERVQKTSVVGASSEQALDDARARLHVERAQLNVAEKALNLVVEGPRVEDIAAAEKRLEALRASLSLLKIRLSDMTLRAPAAGVIQSRILEVGEMAGPTRPVVTLALTDPKWVRAYVPEPELGRIRTSMPAEVFSDSFPGQPFKGWIGFISPVAEFTPKTVETEALRTQLVYEVRVFVHDERDRLPLGMPVTVVIHNRMTPNAPLHRERPAKTAPKEGPEGAV